MQEVLTGHGRAIVLALGLLALPARGIELGEIELLSPLGEKLDARIPVRTRPGEWFHATCMGLAPSAQGNALPGLAGGTLSVERGRNKANLRVRTDEPVQDPALAFAVTSKCAGEAQPSAQEFSVLLDPPEVFARQHASKTAVATRAQPASSPRAATRAAPAPRARPVEVAQSPQPPQVAPARKTAPPAAAPQAEAPASRPAPTPAPSPAQAPASGKPQFVLKLTSDPIDLARTQQFDDKSRAQLRERLRLLDSDDQVAAMLAMRDNLRRLEARVAELQLKLATTTAAIETRPRAEAAPAPAPQPPAPAPQPPAKVEPAPVTPTAAPVAPPPAAKAEPAAPAKRAAAPAASPEASAIDTLGEFVASLPGGVGAWIAALGLLLALVIALWILRRRRDEDADESMPEHEPQARRADEALAHEPAQHGLEEEHALEVAAPLRPEIATDAALATRLEEDTEALRRRYIEERFPEIRNGLIVLDDPGSVVKGARLFYEDGAIPKAVELLRFAIEDRPAQIRPWLALFEIYRLEHLGGEYSELAERFQERYGRSEQWAKVRTLGRELDPANPAFQEAPINALETIGPRDARHPTVVHVDPMAENWLEASMDFENEVLATELRRTLMARANVEDRDLAPNPMPALRSVEMFAVG